MADFNKLCDAAEAHEERKWREEVMTPSKTPKELAEQAADAILALAPTEQTTEKETV